MRKKYSQLLRRCALESASGYFALLAVMSLLTGSLVYRRTQSLLAAFLIFVLASFLYKNRRKYFTICAALSVLLASVLFIYYKVNDNSQIYLAIKYLSCSVGASCLVTLIACWITQPLIKKTAAALLLFSALCIPIIFWGYYLSMDAWFASDTLLAVMQTNAGESKEYLADYFSWSAAVATVFIISAGIIIWRSMQSLLLIRENKRFTVLISAAVLLSGALCYKTRDNLVFDIARDAKKNLQKYADFQKLQAQRKNNIKLAVQNGHVQKGIFVLVIGESQNKEHMSAYGYDRKTTPWLDKVSEKSNFLKFNKAYSCHTHTVPVLTYALTAKNQYNDLQLENAVSILEAAEAAGYETAWLSNQVKYSAWDTPVTVIADEANQQSWLNRNMGETTMTNAYDLKLLDSLKALKISDKMLIVIHLMGNHGSYAERYPLQFAAFSGRGRDIDAYDNSILYNDYVVSQIYEYVKTLPEFNCMLYFADHADAVKERLGHDSGKFVWPMTHIPMYAGFSEQFMNHNPEIFNALTKAQNEVFTNDLLFNMLLGLMKIKIPNVYEKENDITGAYYNSDISRFRTLYGKKFVQEGW